ncbi:MAG TPA: hypothetical protein VGC79_12920 [Polyangiaceae bacterium]
MGDGSIPVDTAKVGESTLTAVDWVRTDDAHERFKALLDAKPQARDRYVAVLAELNGDNG